MAEKNVIENFFQQLEERVMVLLSEREDLVKENQRLQQENSALKSERENHTQKLEGIVSLLESIAVVEKVVPNIANAGVKLDLIQG